MGAFLAGLLCGIGATLAVVLAFALWAAWKVADWIDGV